MTSWKPSLLFDGSPPLSSYSKSTRRSARVKTPSTVKVKIKKLKESKDKQLVETQKWVSPQFEKENLKIDKKPLAKKLFHNPSSSTKTTSYETSNKQSQLNFIRTLSKVTQDSKETISSPPHLREHDLTLPFIPKLSSTPTNGSSHLSTSSLSILAPDTPTQYHDCGLYCQLHGHCNH